ncbi:hypothetical protein Golomagni_06398, partial [Golovinomyces magnicellulatus]
MVNRGRSGACGTCKQRRVKCDETKPQCRSCQRLSLHCEGYAKSKQTTLRFKEQNSKFGAKDNRSISRRHHTPGKIVNDPKLTSNPAEPDNAVDFYLGHYARMGRDMESTRGFFEMLIPVYSTQPQDSALSLAISVLASETLRMWQQDASSFTCPRKTYSESIARLRTAVQDPKERSQPATVFAILTLQIYENACAIYGRRQVSTTHHTGAASLLSFLDANEMDETLRVHLHRFMLHTEVSAALRQKRPLKNIAYSWLESNNTDAVPANPSSSLDAISVLFVELQAIYLELVTKLQDIQLSKCILDDWRTKAKKIETDLLTWAENVPRSWNPRRLVSVRDVDSRVPTYHSICEVYPSCQIASIWNLWHVQRLLLAKMALDFDTLFSNPEDGRRHQGLCEATAYQKTIQDMVDSICYSIPFYLGNRNARSALADFTDPTILLPSTCLKVRQGLLSNGQVKEDLGQSIIAQGPWRAMHPVSRLLTLFSEDDGEKMSSFLRAGQQEWISDQFLRIATLLHLPSQSTEIDQ